MKLPLSWLKEFVNIGDATPEQVSMALLDVGFEVEEIIYVGGGIENVVVGKVIDCKAHENSDHLHKCKVDIGNEVLDIVCGASNVNTGNIVACAKVGAKLPGGINISAGEIRGAKSFGMLCSGKELGIDNSVFEGAEVDGLLQLPLDTKLGQDIKKFLGLDEYVLDISITANRPDCQSVAGISREVAASMGLEYKSPNFDYKTIAPEKSDFMPSVEILAKDVCTRYTGRLIKNIKIEKSPKWMRDRLRMVGVRPINNIVDITNYVLFEMGQPLHAFDIRQIDRGIFVRNAFEGEKLIALDGGEYLLSQDMLVIADKSKGLAIAGIMGGEFSGIKDDTRCVFLEAARFERSNIRRTSRKLGLRSDSSARYEKGVDYESIDFGRERALSLFSALGAGAVVAAKSDAGIKMPECKQISTTAEQISAIIGIQIPQSTCGSILKNLGFGIELKGKSIVCTVPLVREDVEDFADLTEEIIRYYGYKNLHATFLQSAQSTLGGIPEDMKATDGVKSLLCGFGAYEMLSYSFINKKAHDMLMLAESDSRRNALQLYNPLNEDLAVMRTQLTHNMLSALALNQSRGNENFRLFELGKVFIPNGGNEQPVEEFRLSIGIIDKGADFYTLKSIVSSVLKFFNKNGYVGYSKQPFLHPGISADVAVDSDPIGCYGEVHPTVCANYHIAGKCYVAEISISALQSVKKPTIKYSEISKFPSVKRDLAVVVVDKFLVGDIIADIKLAAGEILEDVDLFDIYKGNQIEAGCKSVAFSLKFRHKDRTLAEADIRSVMLKIMNVMKIKYGATLRQ